MGSFPGEGDRGAGRGTKAEVHCPAGFAVCPLRGRCLLLSPAVPTSAGLGQGAVW